MHIKQPLPIIYYVISLAALLYCFGPSPARALDLSEIQERQEPVSESAALPQPLQEVSQMGPDNVEAEENAENALQDEGNELSEEEERIIAEFLGDQEEYDLVLRLERGRVIVSEAMIGIQKGLDNYIPMLDLARIVGFEAEPDFAQGTVSGFFIREDNTYTLDVPAGTYSVKGETYELPPGSVVVRDSGYGLGEFFIKPDVLNEIWPLQLDFDFSNLVLEINTEQKLPYELAQEREARRAALLSGSDEDIDASKYPKVGNDYKLISKPFVSINNFTTYRIRDGGNELRDRLTLRGENDLLYANADYNLVVGSDKNKRFDPLSARLKLTRRSYGDETMPLGLREVEGGDVRYRPSELIGNNNGGRGVTFSSEPNEKLKNFDTITITGTGEPGWEVEVFRRNELLAFGQVDSRGEYVFENIPLFYGNNKIEVVLYGPEGQIERRVEEYRISNQLLAPGETTYQGAIIDENEDLIPLRDTNADKPSGFSLNSEVRRGITQRVTGFATLNHAPTEAGSQTYLSAGADVSLPNGIGQVEGYVSGEGGVALDTRYATEYAGVRLNLQQSLFNDFESEEANFGDEAKISETEIRANRSFLTDIGNFNLSGRFEHIIRKDSPSDTIFNLSQSYSRKNVRLSNRIRTKFSDWEQDRTEGNLLLNYRFLPNWNARSTLLYDIYPEYQERSFLGEIRYDDRDKLTAAANIEHNILAENTAYGVEAAYDFERVRAGLSVTHREERGTDIRLRTSTSLAPVGVDDEYIAKSENLTRRTLLKTRLYIDNDLNGEFSEGDEPLEGVRVRINGRSTDPSNEEGIINMYNAGREGYVVVTLDRESLDNPFLVSEKEGYRTLLRQATEPFIDIPIVESGGVDGTAAFPDGRPVPGMRVQLVNQAGEVVKETPTASDGFFSFEFVKPGQYTLRADPEQKLRVRDKTVEVAQNNLFAYGINMNILPPPELTPQKRKLFQSVVGKLKNIQDVFQNI